MGFRLIPRDTVFFDLFEAAAANIVAAADVLAGLMTPDAHPEEIAARMREIEHEGDSITHRILRQLNSSFVTPFDREDIYRLASSLDDVMDFMEETVDLVGLYELGDLPADFAPQVEVLQRATQLTAEAMPRLRTMKDLDEYWIEINRLENQGDRSYRRIVANLFSGSYKSLEVLKLKDVVDSLEHAIDALESVANTVEQIAVKES